MQPVQPWRRACACARTCDTLHAHACARPPPILQGSTVDELLDLMDLGLSGKHIADLVSSGALLSRVRSALEMVGGGAGWWQGFRGLAWVMSGSQFVNHASWLTSGAVPALPVSPMLPPPRLPHAQGIPAELVASMLDAK